MKAKVESFFPSVPKVDVPMLPKDLAKDFETVSEDELKKFLEQVIKKNEGIMEDKRRAFNILMGEMMKKYRGKADGALIAKVVKEMIE